MIVAGIHLPEDDTHFAEQIATNPLYRNKGTYQWAKLAAALEVCGARRGHAVDVGAHVGLWSRVLSYEFRRVTAFEPMALYAECFKRNLLRRPGVTLHQVALSWVAGQGRFAVAPDGKGTASADPAGDIIAEFRLLDEMALRQVDFLKVDCEGAEIFVLQGGEQTIRRDKPVILCEQKPKRTDFYHAPRDGAVKLLEAWGAEIRWSIKGDHCLSWSA